MGFDNELALRGFKPENFTEMEDIARTTMATTISETERPHYFGVFARDPAKFQFLPGHKALMKGVIDFVQAEKNRTVSKTNLTKTPSTGVIKQGVPNGEKKITSAAQSSCIAAETQYLTRILLNWLKKDSGDSDLMKTESLDVNVTLGEGNHYKAGVKCIFGSPPCTSTVSLLKVENRWSTSNFHRHIKTHIRNKAQLVSQRIPKSGQRRLVDMYQGPHVKAVSSEGSSTNQLTEETEDDPTASISESSTSRQILSVSRDDSDDDTPIRVKNAKRRRIEDDHSISEVVSQEDFTTSETPLKDF